MLHNRKQYYDSCTKVIKNQMFVSRHIGISEDSYRTTGIQCTICMDISQRDIIIFVFCIGI